MLLVRAFPVRCGRREVEEFAEEVRMRGADARRFYTGFGVRRESWFYQERPDGALLIGVTDIAEPLEQAARDYAQTTEHFAAWFKDRVRNLSGIDPAEQPLGPPTELIFDSSGAKLPGPPLMTMTRSSAESWPRAASARSARRSAVRRSTARVDPNAYSPARKMTSPGSASANAIPAAIQIAT